MENAILTAMHANASSSTPTSPMTREENQTILTLLKVRVATNRMKSRRAKFTLDLKVSLAA